MYLCIVDDDCVVAGMEGEGSYLCMVNDNRGGGGVRYLCMLMMTMGEGGGVVTSCVWLIMSVGGGGGSYLCVVDDDRDSLVFQTTLLTDGDSVYRHKQLDPKQRDQNKRGLHCFPDNDQTFFKCNIILVFSLII